MRTSRPRISDLNRSRGTRLKRGRRGRCSRCNTPIWTPGGDKAAVRDVPALIRAFGRAATAAFLRSFLPVPGDRADRVGAAPDPARAGILARRLQRSVQREAAWGVCKRSARRVRTDERRAGSPADLARRDRCKSSPVLSLRLSAIGRGTAPYPSATAGAGASPRPAFARAACERLRSAFVGVFPPYLEASGLRAGARRT
jgi:hypothetical protein